MVVSMKPPTLSIFSPPEIKCDAPSGHPIFKLQEVLIDAMCVLSMSYVTYNVNVVSLDLMFNIYNIRFVIHL